MNGRGRGRDGDLKAARIAEDCGTGSPITSAFALFHSSLPRLPKHKISTAHGGARRLGISVAANLSKADERITLCFAALSSP